MLSALAGLLVAGLSASTATAQTIDLGVIRQEDITVVQRLLYPKDNRSEFGIAAGIMPFDPYLTTPNGQLWFVKHFSERGAFNLVVGGGYGIKTGVYKQLESPAYGVAPYAYRYLASGLAGGEWSPIYAKLNWGGGRIAHFDVYLAGRGGLTIEESVIPDGGIAYAPTLSPALGGRFFLGQSTALKIEIRDDLLVEYRSLTDSWEFKQNANVTVGLAVFSKRKDVIANTPKASP
jgi:outer membrane beta-barrel protein